MYQPLALWNKAHVSVPCAGDSERCPVPPPIRILSSPQSPRDAFVAVPYGQNWYWIDDKDFASKRLFSFIMFLFTLTETWRQTRRTNHNGSRRVKASQIDLRAQGNH